MFVALLLETSKRLDLNTYLNLLKNSGEWTRLTLPYNHSRRDYGFAGYGLKSKPETYIDIRTGKTKLCSKPILIQFNQSGRYCSSGTLDPGSSDCSTTIKVRIAQIIRD